MPPYYRKVDLNRNVIIGIDESTGRGTKEYKQQPVKGYKYICRAFAFFLFLWYNYNSRDGNLPSVNYHLCKVEILSAFIENKYYKFYRKRMLLYA